MYVEKQKYTLSIKEHTLIVHAHYNLLNAQDACLRSRRTSPTVSIPWMTESYKKDLEDIQGLISVDRSSKATQPLTIPRPIQVVCKGSSPKNRQVW